MRKLDAIIRRKISEKDDEWVQKAKDIVEGLRGQDKERQLRNIQGIAEGKKSERANSGCCLGLCD